MKNKAPVFIIAIVVILGIVAAIVYGATKNGNDDMESMDMSSHSHSDSSQHSSDENAQDAVATDMVTIQNFEYGPATITVKKGTKVTWTNKDTVKHNVVGDDLDALNGPLLEKGETYSYTFDTVGTFSYHCMPHPYMKGTVIVTE